MKKLSSLLFCIFFLTSAYSQSLKRGDVRLNTGIGFGIYGLMIGDSSETAATSIFPINFEYGVADKITSSLNFQVRNYVVGEDTANKDRKSSVSGISIGIGSAFHFLVGDKADMYIGMIAGYNSFNLEIEDKTDKSSLSGGGFTFQIPVGWKLYFNDHIALMLEAGYGGYMVNLTDYSENGTTKEIDGELKDGLDMGGVDAKIGLEYKF